MRVWVIAGVVLGLLTVCQPLGFVPGANIPLVIPGPLGALPVAALLSLQAAFIVKYLKDEDFGFKYKGYKKEPEPDYYYEPEATNVEPESSYVSYRSFAHARRAFPPPPSDPSPSYRPFAQRYHKRSTTQETWGEEVVELEKLLVSAASRLDTDGCVLKLLCHLNNKQAHARTLEENVLLQLFSNNPDTLSFYHATFDNTAADVSKTQEQVATAACDKVFSSCTLGQEELSSLLQHTWPCPTITP
ncbi:uncharacterized protein [Panulirus ornatus]|uniref:uncharacterized protein n=1 Tax=Panulirus ornatus TaxID=150431 RepID=UPI003A86D816